MSLADVPTADSAISFLITNGNLTPSKWKITQMHEMANDSEANDEKHFSCRKKV